MRAAISVVIACIAILASGYTFAGCSGGGCGPGYCNPNESKCQCTDPSCNSPWDTDCTSRAYCCEAFGNVGGR